MTAQCF